MLPGTNEHIIRYAPLWAYLFVYAISSLIASILFYAGYSPFIFLTAYFSGVEIPSTFSHEQRASLFALLFGAPALFTLGYIVAMRVRTPFLAAAFRAMSGGGDLTITRWIPIVLFAAASTLGAYDIARAGAFSMSGAWFDYGRWVQSRWELFSILGYFNFVNLYLIVPITAAWTIMNIQKTGKLGYVVRCTCILIVMVLTFFLFQKKALITALIIIIAALLIHKVLVEGWNRRLTRVFVACIGLLAALYFMMVVLPIYSETTKTAYDVLESTEQQIERIEKPEQQHKQIEKPEQQHKQIEKPEQQHKQIEKQVTSIATLLGVDRKLHILAYALMAPLTRTSVPALYYPIVFPDHHEFYGLDLGQDILGYGNMPDDNLVVWKYLYPDLPGGSIAVPFQFVLYSQVGTTVALLLSTFIGGLIGVLWKSIVIEDGNVKWRSLMGAMLMLFSVYLAIDSIRNSVVASYGVIWGWLFISVFFFIGRMIRHKLNVKPA